MRDPQRRVELLARGDLDAAPAALGLDDLDHAVDVADLGLALGHARLEQLLDARQTGGDVQAGDAAGVERPHGQLRAGLADRLRGDDAHRLADADQLAGGQVAAVARRQTPWRDWHVSGERTRTSSTPASTMRSAISSVISWLRSTIGSAPFLRAVGSVDRTGRVATDDAALERVRLGRVLLGLGARDPRAFLGAAVVRARDDVLRHVDESAGQVARVGGAEGGVGQTLARAVGRDEVLEHGHALAEVAPHGHVDDPTGRVGHQAAHAAQLADVALVTAGAGRGHHRHRTRADRARPSSGR